MPIYSIINVGEPMLALLDCYSDEKQPYVIAQDLAFKGWIQFQKLIKVVQGSELSRFPLQPLGTARPFVAR